VKVIKARGINRHILDLETRWKLLTTFKPWSNYLVPKRCAPGLPLNGRLDGLWGPFSYPGRGQKPDSSHIQPVAWLQYCLYHFFSTIFLRIHRLLMLLNTEEKSVVTKCWKTSSLQRCHCDAR